MRDFGYLGRILGKLSHCYPLRKCASHDLLRSMFKNLFWGLIIVGFAGAGYYYLTKNPESTKIPTGSPSAQEPTPPTGTPSKPVPNTLPAPVKSKPFRGCPAEGRGGDPLMNIQKNRDHEPSSYQPVTFDWILGLPEPKEIHRKDRQNWRLRDVQMVASYEQMAVTVEGYIAAAKTSGPETTNCSNADNDMLDFHVWLVKTRRRERAKSIIIEPTPRLRAKNHGWALSRLNAIANTQKRVRISGWLFMDPEHPEQLGKTRATLWEIHPVMKIEVEEGGQWVKL